MDADDLASWATELEASAGPDATHVDLSKVFREVRDELAEDDPRSLTAGWEQMIFDLFLPHQDEFREKWGPLAPMLTSEDGTCYPPRIEDFPDDAVAHYERRVDLARVPAARARLEDFLWVRTRNHLFARRAIASYVEAFRAVSAENYREMLREEYLQRALDIGRRLNDVPAELREVLVTHAEELLAGGALGYICQLVRHAAKELAEDQSRARPLLNGLRDRAATEAASGGQDRYAERSYLEAAAVLAKQLGETELAAELYRESARSHEREADERASEGAMIRAALLHDALTAYADAGMSADLERVKGLLNEASTEAVGELKSVSSSVTVSREELEQVVDGITATGERLGEHGILYALALTNGLWPEWSEIEAQTSKTKQDFPLQYLFRKLQIGPDGQQLPRPADEEAAKLFDEAELYVRRLQIALQFIDSEIRIFEERGIWTLDAVLAAILASPLFEGADPAIKSGIEAFVAERHWDATHVLVPQIERALRGLARGVGVDVYAYENKTGRIRWAPLDRILVAEPVRAVLNSIKPSLALELELLLLDPAGLNLRNDVAHGVLDPKGDTRARSLLCVMILLVLGFLRARSDTGE